MPHRHVDELFETEISPRFEPHDVQALVDEIDERQEQGAVETFVVKLRRHDVGGRHHHDAALQQAGEQASQNHCVSDIGNVKFVETQDPRLGGKVVGCETDWVAFRYFTEFQPVAIGPEALVNIEHERVKVHPSFALHRACGEKKVHQHRLDAAHLAPNVEPFKLRFGRFALSEQPTQGRRFAR